MRVRDALFHKVQKSGLEGMAHIGETEKIDLSPNPGIAYTAFRYEAVYMRIPFQRPAKCVKDKDITRCEVLTLVHFVEHLLNNTAGSFE